MELANKIKDVKLRRKVIEFIKDPSLSHKDFKKYPRMSIDEAKCLFSLGSGNITAERDILNHSIALADLCLKVADVLEKNYNISVNRDHLLAAALVHDIVKIYEWKKTKGNIEHTGILLDHSMLGVAELYRREFPEKVIHIVASHFGESGPTPPRNIEALVFHYCDTLLSLIEFHRGAKPTPQSIQLFLIDKEFVKKLSDETEK